MADPKLGLEATLREIQTDDVSGHVIFSHSRAASHGGVREVNLHPFVSGEFVFMHNGGEWVWVWVYGCESG